MSSLFSRALSFRVVSFLFVSFRFVSFVLFRFVSFKTILVLFELYAVRCSHPIKYNRVLDLVLFLFGNRACPDEEGGSVVFFLATRAPRSEAGVGSGGEDLSEDHT